MLTSNINPYGTSNPNRNPTVASESTHPTHPATATHTRRKTKSEDLHILAHAQGQLRSHLEPHDSQTYQNQHPQSAWPHTRYTGSRPRSSHQPFPGTFASSTSRPDLRTPVTNLPSRWWEAGLLSHPSHFDSEEAEEEVRQSIERDPSEIVIESIEVDEDISPGTVPTGTAETDDSEAEDIRNSVEARLWDEAQRDWNGYVKLKESWVRRAGLKRSKDDASEQSSVKKKGKIDG